MPPILPTILGDFEVNVEGTDTLEGVEVLEFDNVTLTTSACDDIVFDLDLHADAGDSNTDTFADGILAWDPTSGTPLAAYSDNDWTITEIDGEAVDAGDTVDTEYGTLTVTDAVGADGNIDTIRFDADASLSNSASNLDETIEITIVNATSGATETLTVNLRVVADVDFAADDNGGLIEGSDDDEVFAGGTGQDRLRGEGGDDSRLMQVLATIQ